MYHMRKTDAKRPTLRDVSRISGVSIGTVSKYINDPYSVKENNRIAIADTIKILNYTPNTLAQRLAKGNSNTILLYSLSERTINPSTWLHQLPLIQSLSDTLQNTEYSLQIKIGSVFDKESYSYIKNCIDRHSIDAIVILSAWTVPKDIILMMLKEDFPFVLIDSRNPVLNSNEILFDNHQITEGWVDQLYALGHRKIGFIHVNNAQQHMSSRFNGYCDGMKKHGLEIRPGYVQYGDFSIDSGYACINKMLDDGIPCTALICGNDNMAVGAVKAIKAHGLSVPDDISVVGIDDSVLAQACDPVLYTVHIPMAEMGRLAVEELLQRIDNPDYQIDSTTIPFYFVEGASIGKAKQP